MNPAREAWACGLAGALEAHAVAVVQMAPGHWTFAPAGAPGLHARAQIADDWLLFDAPLPEPAATSAWAVFAINGGLTGGLKICAAGPDPALRLRAELPLFEQSPVARTVEQVCAGLAAIGAGMPPDRPGVAAAGVDLPQLCADTSWPFTLRGTDTVMVELDVPGAFQQATVELQPNRGVVVSVPVLAEPPRVPVCEAAVSAFLLRVTGAVRMVRAAAAASGWAVGFEVVSAYAPSAEELAHAFASLSLAWRCAGREAAVLAADERVAQAYLRATDFDLRPWTLDLGL